MVEFVACIGRVSVAAMVESVACADGVSVGEARLWL